MQALRHVEVVSMAPREAWGHESSATKLMRTTLTPAEETNLTALVMHTSGSTGMPKVL